MKERVELGSDRAENAGILDERYFFFHVREHGKKSSLSAEGTANRTLDLIGHLGT